VTPAPKRPAGPFADLVTYVRAWAETPTEDEQPSEDAEALVNALDRWILRARDLIKKHGLRRRAVAEIERRWNRYPALTEALREIARLGGGAGAIARKALRAEKGGRR
jgi:hypothetical protein